MFDLGVITNAGKSLLAEYAQGKTLTIKGAKTGSGTVKESALMAQTELVSVKQAMSIVKNESVESGVKLYLQLTSEGVTEEYTINQIGVFASTGDTETLLAIIQDETGVTVPTYESMPDFVFDFCATLQMDNTGSIAITLDTTASVTWKDLNDALAVEIADRKNADNNKVDKSAEVNVVHCTNSSGEETTKAISDFVLASELANLMEKIYPIGSLYWSSKATNPSELFGGTWTQIKDKFVLACGDTYKAEATGGSASVTLSVANMPSHTHSFNCSGTTSGMSAHSTGSFKTLNFSDSPRAGAVTAVDGSTFTDDSSTNASHSTYWANSGRSMAGSTSYYGHHTIGLNVSHTHTLTVKGTTGTSGSGTAVSIMPPYVVKYCFERIA